MARRRAWLYPLALFLVVEAVYLSNGRMLGNMDTVPARYLPFSLIREADFDYDEFEFLFQGVIAPTVFRHSRGRFVSIYSPVPGILATPFYLAPVLLGVGPRSPWVPHLEKIAAATITALSAMFVFLLLRAQAGEGLALGLTAIYAFGTAAFSISSQALWQHGPSQLLLAAGLYLLARGGTRPRLVAWSGLLLGAAVVTRYTDLLLVLPVAWYVGRHHGRRLLGWLALASLPAAALLAYNAVHFGSPLEVSYGGLVLAPGSSYWSAPLGYALSGLLVSPISGLFVYSPIFVFALLGMAVAWRRRGATLWRCLSAGPVLVVLLMSKWNLWWSYWYYGPRLLSDLAPVLVVFLWPAWEALKPHRIARAGFVAAAAASMVIHAIGAFGYDGSWYASPVAIDHDRIWSWRDSPIVHYGSALAGRTISALRARVSDAVDTRDASDGLAGAIVVDRVPDVQQASRALRLLVSVKNAGQPVWAPGTSTGSVNIEWQWRDEHTRLIAADGSVPLSQPVFPGAAIDTPVIIWPPSSGARYALRIGAVREPDLWFAERQMTVSVEGLCDFAGVMKEPVVSLPAPPSLDIVSRSVTLPRGAEVGVFFLAIANGPTLRNLALVLALGAPDGRLHFVFTNRSTEPNPPCREWVPLAVPVTLAPGFHIDDNFPLTVLLRDKPSGRYVWHATLLEPYSARVVARASRAFDVGSP